MAAARWKESGSRSRSRTPREREAATGSAIPELVRRALAAGFSGFFLTEKALREAIGDSLPREWADFAAEQSTRTRTEFIERLSVEMGRAIENIDWPVVLAALLEGRTIEVSAQIRLGAKDGGERGAVSVRLDSK